MTCLPPLGLSAANRPPLDRKGGCLRYLRHNPPMIKMVNLALLVFAVALFAGCEDNGGSSGEEEFVLVGFTSTTHLGDTGVLGFTQACNAEFSDSRMCTSVEVMETVDVPGGLSGNAWVRPVALFADSSSSEATDASGQFSSSCSGWSNTFGSGLSVSGSGQFGGRDCEPFFSDEDCPSPEGCAVQKVACCAAD